MRCGLYFHDHSLEEHTVEKRPEGVLPAPLKCGVSLAFLQRFAMEHSSEACMTTGEVVQRIVRPLTEDKQCR